MVAPAAGASPDELPLDVDLIKVLASDSRRDILRLLGERRRTLTELADAMGLKKATVLEHLQKLVAADLIRRLDEDERLWIYYELTPRGVRLVRPGRTRFYLLLSGTAAAALVVGALITFALLAPSDAPLVDERASAPKLVDDASGVISVAWRGFDADVPIALPAGLPPNGTLQIRGSASATSLALQDSAARMDANALDALQPGLYGFALEMPEGRIEVPGSLRVADPPIAIFPRVATAGSNVTLQLSIAGPDAPTAPAPVAIDGVPAQVSGDARRFTAEAPAVAPGEAIVEVGRLLRAPIRILPDLRVEASHDNGTLVLVTSVPGVEIALDGAPLAVADANGTARAAWPATGPHVLRLANATAERTIAFYFSDRAAGPLAPQLRLEPVDARLGGSDLRVRVDVHNDGPAPEFVTLVARDAGALLATALVEVPAGSRAEALLEAPLAHPARVEVEAYAARDPAGLSKVTARGAPPAAPAGLTSDGMAYDAYASSARPDARATLQSAVAPSPVAASQVPVPEAAVPFPGAWVILAAALAAFAAGRRRR